MNKYSPERVKELVREECKLTGNQYISDSDKKITEENLNLLIKELEENYSEYIRESYMEGLEYTVREMKKKYLREKETQTVNKYSSDRAKELLREYSKITGDKNILCTEMPLTEENLQNLINSVDKDSVELKERYIKSLEGIIRVLKSESIRAERTSEERH